MAWVEVENPINGVISSRKVLEPSALYYTCNKAERFAQYSFFNCFCCVLIPPSHFACILVSLGGF